MPFLRPSLAELVTRIQADLATRLELVGGVMRRSVVDVLARVSAGAAHGLHGHLEYMQLQIFPDTSELEFLERQAALYGLSQSAASFATGTVTATGTDGKVIPAASLLQRPDGVQYAVDASVAIASGTATLAVTAVAAGVGGNADTGVVLAFVAPLVAVVSTVTVAAPGLEGGADAESDDALRTRLLTRLRQPPHGGADFDYVAWAKEVAGVTRVWVYPQELGPGRVTVRFVRDDDGSLIPSVGEVADVQAYLDARRPVTAVVTVVAPVAVSLNFSIALDPDTPETRVAVEAELVDLLRRTAEPGGPIRRSHIDVAVGAAVGVDDFSVTVPAADVTHTTGQIAVMGTVTWL